MDVYECTHEDSTLACRFPRCANGWDWCACLCVRVRAACGCAVGVGEGSRTQFFGYFCGVNIIPSQEGNKYEPFVFCKWKQEDEEDEEDHVFVTKSGQD